MLTHENEYFAIYFCKYQIKLTVPEDGVPEA